MNGENVRERDVASSRREGKSQFREGLVGRRTVKSHLACVIHLPRAVSASGTVSSIRRVVPR